MGFKDSIKNLFVIDEDEFEEEEFEEEVREEKPAREERSRREEKSRRDYSAPSKTIAEPAREFKAKPAGSFSVTNPSAFKMLLIEPKSVDECRMLVDSLKGRRPVIVNLEKIETETARKIFDFLSGAVYALNGNVQKVSNNIFIFAPENVDISEGSGRTSGFDFGTDKSPWR